jgi:hypothetical protein
MLELINTGVRSKLFVCVVTQNVSFTDDAESCCEISACYRINHCELCPVKKLSIKFADKRMVLILQVGWMCSLGRERFFVGLEMALGNR